MKCSKVILATTVFSVSAIMGVNQTQAADGKIYRYVITETAGATSLDPLEADNTNNLPVARMIYATPLEISEENQLSSHVLESFQYDSSTRTIKWVVKAGLKFDDGTPITPDDVAFSVARMAYTRPQFPVVESIEGVETWSKSKGALKSFPSGISVKGQAVSIKLAKNIEHPLFRFCLELFSIIPKKCVDTESNKIVCKEVPSSGYYRIAEKSKDVVLFVKRDDAQIDGLKVPAKVRFEYISAEDLPKSLGSLDDMTVFAGNEVTYPSAELQKIEEKFSTKFTPASRFSVLLLNPKVAPFKDKKCRQYFAKNFRESYSELAGKSQPLEASIFTKILPGYLSVKELGAERQLSDKDIAECRSTFAKAKLSWGYADGEMRSTFIDTLRKTFEKIGVKPAAPTVAANRKDLADLFTDGKISVFSGSSGFWALDPSGDMKMLFTPNLHKALKFVSDDSKLQKMISELDSGQGNYAQVNRYIHDEATFNVYSHLRRFFASPSKKLLVDVPFAITSPAPWQVFKVN